MELGIDVRMFLLPKQEIGDYIRGEFRTALDEVEHAAHDQEREAAAARLSRATRNLYDFVGYDKVPPDFQFKRSATRS